MNPIDHHNPNHNKPTKRQQKPFHRQDEDNNLLVLSWLLHVRRTAITILSILQKSFCIDLVAKMTSIVEVRGATTSRESVMARKTMPAAAYRNGTVTNITHRPYRSHTTASISQLFPKCRKLAYDSRQQLSQVQNGIMYPSELFLSLDELSRQLDIMSQLVQKETPAQRDVWKRKIQELKEEAEGIRRQGEQYDRLVNTNVRHQREREELLTRRRQRKEFASGTEERDLANLADEATSWQQSHYMVNDLIANGEASYNALKDQRRQMTGVRKYLGQIDDRLGISNSTMRIIERRDVTDAYFVLGGCVLTCITIYFVWF
jgi:Golgi SNAP receptor complex protein 2